MGRARSKSIRRTLTLRLTITFSGLKSRCMKPLSWTCSSDMAMALEHVHDSGFMHLDFKPENVMVSRNVNVRLIDFDLALPIPKAPIKLSKNPGTPSYMAPE